MAHAGFGAVIFDFVSNLYTCQFARVMQGETRFHFSRGLRKIYIIVAGKVPVTNNECLVKLALLELISLAEAFESMQCRSSIGRFRNSQ